MKPPAFRDQADETEWLEETDKRGQGSKEVGGQIGTSAVTEARGSFQTGGGRSALTGAARTSS